MANAMYPLRVSHLVRTVPERSDTNEALAEWVDPPEGSGRYSARRIQATAGEDISQGFKDSSGIMRIEIVGRRLPMRYDDRMKVVTTGQIWRVAAEPVVLERVTQYTLELVNRIPEKSSP